MTALNVPCTDCHTPPGTPCRAVRRGRRVDLPQPHAPRVRLAEDAARRAAGVSKYAGVRVKVPGSPRPRARLDSPQVT